MQETLISMVIPCFNESETIGEFYRRVSDIAEAIEPYEFEFVFVNDGSTDETPSILNTLAEEVDALMSR